MGAPAVKLIHCPACRKQVSSQADACPTCAQPLGVELIKRNAFKKGGKGWIDIMPHTRELPDSAKKVFQIVFLLGGIGFLMLIIGFMVY